MISLKLETRERENEEEEKEERRRGKKINMENETKLNRGEKWYKKRL